MAVQKCRAVEILLCVIFRVLLTKPLQLAKLRYFPKLLFSVCSMAQVISKLLKTQVQKKRSCTSPYPEGYFLAAAHVKGEKKRRKHAKRMVAKRKALKQKGRKKNKITTTNDKAGLRKLRYY